MTMRERCAFRPLVATLLALVPCAQAARTGAADGPTLAACALCTPRPRALSVEDGLSLAGLVDRYTSAVGDHFLVAPGIRSRLEQTSVGLPALDVSAEDAQTLVEQLLVDQGLMLCPVRTEAPRIFRMLDRSQPVVRGVRERTFFVEPEELEHFVRHPAVVITTLVRVPHADGRQLSTSVRALLTDNNTQSLSPAGSTDAVLVTGFGPFAIGVADLCGRADASSAAGAREHAVLKLAHAEAWRVAPVLSAVFGASPEQEEGSAAEAGAPRILHDVRTNSVVVSATPRDLAAVRRVVEQLDTAD